MARVTEGLPEALQRVQEQQARLEQQELRITALEMAGQVTLLPEQRLVLAQMKVIHQVLSAELRALLISPH
jgi:hypothetical protein